MTYLRTNWTLEGFVRLPSLFCLTAYKPTHKT